MAQKTYIIAEAGVNHNGSLDLAFKLIDAARNAGADAVKFQTFKAERIATNHAAKAEYQKVTTGEAAESQLAMLRKLELTDEAHHQLMRYCKRTGIDFLSTPFDLESLRFLTDELQLKLLKISSGDIVHGPLLLEAAKAGVSVILSTGMSTMEEIELAVAVLAFGYLYPDGNPTIEKCRAALAEPSASKILRDRVRILHCVSEYPAPASDLNLRVIPALSETFGLEAGFSDHSKGIAASIAAVALGATVIEKHFTLDKTMPGPDHQASLDPIELGDLVRGIRDVELALGSSRKAPVDSEIRNIHSIRKSIVAARSVREGERFTSADLAYKRPGNGLSPMQAWSLLGTAAKRDYRLDESIEL